MALVQSVDYDPVYTDGYSDGYNDGVETGWESFAHELITQANKMFAMDASQRLRVKWLMEKTMEALY